MVLLGSGEFTYEVSGEDWGVLPEGATLKEATAVDVDANDDVYVFNRGTHPMIVFDSDGKVIRTWGHGVFKNPHGVKVAPDGTIWCVDSGDHTVRQFTPEGKLLFTLGESGKAAPPMSGIPFNTPAHIAFDARNGEYYVADGYTNASVHKYSPDGKLLFSWGEPGTGAGQFNIVHYVGVDNNGYVYIADRENQRVQVFDSQGKFEAQWNDMSRAACLCFDNAGNQRVYVGEYFCGIGSNFMATDLGPRVSIYETSGKLLMRLGRESYGADKGRFYSPHGIAVDSKGDIYVAEVSWADYGSKMDPPKELRSMQKLIKK